MWKAFFGTIKGYAIRQPGPGEKDPVEEFTVVFEDGDKVSMDRVGYYCCLRFLYFFRLICYKGLIFMIE